MFQMNFLAAILFQNLIHFTSLVSNVANLDMFFWLNNPITKYWILSMLEFADKKSARSCNCFIDCKSLASIFWIGHVNANNFCHIFLVKYRLENDLNTTIAVEISINFIWQRGIPGKADDIMHRQFCVSKKFLSLPLPYRLP
jgi:hypothetical protein